MQSEIKTRKYNLRGSVASYRGFKPLLGYQTSGGGTQLGQIEARPFVWVTVKALICMQAYRTHGSTELTHTLIYVLISPYVLFSSFLPQLPFLSPFLSLSEPPPYFFLSLFLPFFISFSSFSPCLVSSLLLSYPACFLFPSLFLSFTFFYSF